LDPTWVEQGTWERVKPHVLLLPTLCAYLLTSIAYLLLTYVACLSFWLPCVLTLCVYSYMFCPPCVLVLFAHFVICFACCFTTYSCLIYCCRLFLPAFTCFTTCFSLLCLLCLFHDLFTLAHAYFATYFIALLHCMFCHLFLPWSLLQVFLLFLHASPPTCLPYYFFVQVSSSPPFLGVSSLLYLCKRWSIRGMIILHSSKFFFCFLFWICNFYILLFFSFFRFCIIN